MNIVGNSIKFAVVSRLKENFPNVNVYTGSVAKAKYPNFVVNQISAYLESVGRNRFKADFLINVSYWHTAEPLCDKTGKLETALDSIGFELTFVLDRVSVQGKPVRAYNARYEKVDGTVQYTAEYSLMLTKEQAEHIKMNNVIERVEVI